MQLQPNQTAAYSEIGQNNWPRCGPETVYDYSFSAWPDEECPRWNRATFALFQMLTRRIVMEFTERAFNDFREDLAKVGIAIREIERVPHLEPATVL